MIWYIENLARNRSERERLEALETRAEWLAPVGWRIDASLRLIWDADMWIGGKVFPISLRYPNHFPYSPPLVLPRGVMERWSIHQYGAAGELCLEYGADNWHSSISGADMVESAHRLLQKELPSGGEAGIVASRHNTTLGQDLRGTMMRFLITRGVIEVLSRIDEGMVLPAKGIVLRHKESYVIAVSSIPMPDGEPWVESVPTPLLTEVQARQIVLWRWPEHLPLPSTESLTVFRTALAGQQLELQLASVFHAVLVQGNQIRAYFLYEPDDCINEVAVIPAQADSPRMDADHAALVERKVGIIGCGSLGSKVAVMLARAGVGRFLLVDDDLILPDNFIRHDLDWRDVGRYKVDGLADRIKLVHPAARCDRRRWRLGGQEASGTIESLLESLATCDLVIDATAEGSVFNYLCAVVAISGKPLVWAEVFGGGFGGLIARHRPGIEPDPASMRLTIENWCAERGKPIERPINRYEGGPTAPAIADDADVTVIAAHAARMAIDLLIPRAPSAFPHSVYLLGLTERWNFNAPFETYPIAMPEPMAAPLETIDPEEAISEQARILKLFEEFGNAANSTPSSGEAVPE